MIGKALSLLFLSAASMAQSATVQYYGTGCSSGGPPPRITITGLPILGQSVTVGFNSLPNGRTPVSEDKPVLLIGRTAMLRPIPAWSATQIAGCTQLASPDQVQEMPWLGSQFQQSFTLAVPNVPQLVGLSVYLQWVDLYSRCQGPCVPQMVRCSNAAKATLGF